MVNGKFVLVSLAMAGGAVAAYAIGRHTRHQDKRQLKQDLHNWEDEGGNLAPPQPPAETVPPATP